MKLFFSKVMFLTLENPDRQAIFLSKSYSVVIRKQYARHSFL
jgi:hypothetical protein